MFPAPPSYGTRSSFASTALPPYRWHPDIIESSQVHRLSPLLVSGIADEVRDVASDVVPRHDILLLRISPAERRIDHDLVHPRLCLGHFLHQHPREHRLSGG